MKRILVVLVALTGVLSFSSFSPAESKQGKISSFTQLPEIITQFGDPAVTLLVMDDDDTLTMMPCNLKSPMERCQYLGGPAWFSWQDQLLNHYLDKKGDSPFRIASNQQQLFDISSLLFSLSDMVFTEESIPSVLNTLTQQGVRLLVETARGSSDVSSTQRQFRALNSARDGETFEQFIQQNALVFQSGYVTSLASPYAPCRIPGSRPISYSQGMMFLAGQNKGVMLKCFVQHYNQNAVQAGLGLRIKNIVFLDDTLENVTHVYDAFKMDPEVRVRAYHYTALQPHKAALTMGKYHGVFQEKAHKRWSAIKTTMEAQLLIPNL